MRSFLDLLLFAALAGMTGCGPSERSDPRLHLASASDPGSLDPAFAKDVVSGRIVGYLYSTLVKFDLQMNLVGDLAESYTISPDGLTYTFVLRPGLKFASGRPLTADDVRHSFTRVLDPKTASPRTWVLDKIAGAAAFVKGEAPDVTGITVEPGPPGKVVLRLEQPFSPFLGLLSMPAASIIDREAIQDHPEDFHRRLSAGTGPYALKAWQKDAQIELVPNPHYHLKAPTIGGVVVRILKEPITLTSEFALGNLDIIQVPSQAFTSLWADPRWKDLHHETAGLNVYFIGMNCEKGLFSDVKVRRAVSWAVDREKIIRTVRRDQAQLAKGPIPPTLPGYDPGFQPFHYDSAKARQLLAEAGVAPGTEVRLLQGDQRENLEVTQMVKAYLEKAGLTVKLVTLEWSVFRGKVDKGDFDLYYLSWFADYPDAENFLYPLFHSSRHGGAGNGPRYTSPEVDQLLQKCLEVVDLSARVELYRTIERKVIEDAPRLYLFHKNELWARQPWVGGFELHPVFNGNRLESVALDTSRFARKP